MDQSRIFATGKSEGGGFTALLACRLPHRIAAFATVSGAFYPGTDAGGAGSPPVPLVDFHGTGDHAISYDGGVSHGEHYPSMASWLRRRTSHDKCADPTATTTGSDVTELDWHGCAAGSALVHYRVAGGGHTWPGALATSGPGAVSNTVSATSVMWTFFLGRPLAQASEFLATTYRIGRRDDLRQGHAVRRPRSLRQSRKPSAATTSTPSAYGTA